MSDSTAALNTRFDALSGGRRGIYHFSASMIWMSVALSCQCAQAAFGADAASPPSQKAIVQEVVRVANKFIEHGPCEPSRAEPSVVATMSPYTPDVAAGRAAAEYAVLWSGDIGCSGGSGTNTMNFLLVEKRGTAAPLIVGLGPIDDASHIERIVAATADTLIIDVYTWGPDDPPCCGSHYERWTLQREPGPQNGRYTLNRVDSKPAQPTPLKPSEKRLPTAK